MVLGKTYKIIIAYVILWKVPIKILDISEVVVFIGELPLRVPGGVKSRIPEVVAEILNYCGNYRYYNSITIYCLKP